MTGTIPLAFANPFGETKGIPYDEFTGLLYVGGPGHTSRRRLGCPQGRDGLAHGTRRAGRSPSGRGRSGATCPGSRLPRPGR